MKDNADAALRGRMERFYSKYAPEKLVNLDTLLETYRGRERELFQALTTKYGPEPTSADSTTGDAAGPPSAPGPVTASDARQIVARYFALHAPEKAGSIDMLMTKYAGMEADLIGALHSKYGPLPPVQPQHAPAATKPPAQQQQPQSVAGGSTKPGRVPVLPLNHPGPSRSTGGPAAEHAAGDARTRSSTQLVKGPSSDEPLRVSDIAQVAAHAPTTTTTKKAARFAVDEDERPREPTGAPNATATTAAKHHHPPEVMPATTHAVATSAPAHPTATSTAPAQSSGHSNQQFEPAESPATGGAAAMPVASHSVARSADTPRGEDPSNPPEFYEDEAKQYTSPQVQVSSTSPPAGAAAIPRVDRAPHTLVPTASVADVTIGIPEAEVRKRAATKARLVRFYQHYAPEKVSQVDVALRAYRGREEIMFQLLEAKYGPEAAVYEEDDEEEASEASRVKAMINASIASSPQVKIGATGRAFDPVVAAKLLGPHIDLGYLGPGNEKFAATIILMLNAIGHDKLFDATQATLPMPPCTDRDTTALDRFAFERVLHFRFVWIDAWFRGLELRNMELAERRVLCDHMTAERRAILYAEYVRQQAVKLIVPIENERRQLVKEEEALRFAGAVSWFRQTRDAILIERLSSVESAVLVSAASFAQQQQQAARSASTRANIEILNVLRSAGTKRSTSPHFRSASRSPLSRPHTDVRSPSASGATFSPTSPAARRTPAPSFEAPPSPAAVSWRDLLPAATAAPSPSAERYQLLKAKVLDLTATAAHTASPGADTVPAARHPSPPQRTSTSASVGGSARRAPPHHGSGVSANGFLTQARRIAGARGQFSQHGALGGPSSQPSSHLGRAASTSVRSISGGY